MKKIIFCDLDGTLLTDDKQISAMDIETITNLKETKFVIATGRGFESIEFFLKTLNQYDKENEYLMSFNGGCVSENKGNRILASNPMDFNDVERLFNIGLNYNVTVEVYSYNCTYCYKVFDYEMENLVSGKHTMKVLDNPDISFLKNEKIAKVIYCNTDEEYLKQARKQINLDDQYSIAYSSHRYIEINPKGIDKKLGVQNLCKVLNFDIKDTIAVGDNTNDIPMLEIAGYSVGVKNSVEEIVPYCDLILDSTNNENPITELVNKLNLK